MGKNIKIKSYIKFDDYNLKIFNEDIQLVGIGNKKIEMDKSLDSKMLVRSTRELGEKIYSHIVKYFESKRIELYDIINHDNIKDRKTINTKIIDFAKNFCNIRNKTCSHYFSMYDFYKEAYSILNIEKTSNQLIAPKEFYDLLLSYDRKKHFIYDRDNFKPWNYYSNIIESNYRAIVELLEKNKDKFNYQILSKSINYIPTNIKDFFKEIFILNTENYNKNEPIREIFNCIKDYCNKYGMPFWTIRESIAEITIKKQYAPDEFEVTETKECNTTDFSDSSAYEISNNTIPINNLIFISLLIYLFTNLWSEFITNDKYDFDIEIDKYIDLFALLGIDIDFGKTRNSSIKEFFESAEIFDDYILVNCNSIYKFPLKIYRKKVTNKNKGNKLTFYTETVYESVIIAAWDAFYTDFLGNSNIKIPLSHCNYCNKEIDNKPHRLRGNNIFLCDKCYKEHVKELGRKRINIFRKS